MMPYETIYDLPEILEAAYSDYLKTTKIMAKEIADNLKLHRDVRVAQKIYERQITIVEKLDELNNLINEDCY
jgi:hypothetical protein